MFTMHGTTMIFLAAMPIVFGFANYLVPLMVGARDMAFPRLNAWSFWMSALGGIILYFSFVGGSGLYGVGQRSRRGLVRLCPPDLPRIFGREQHRLLDHRHTGSGLRQHRHGAEHRDHHPLHALSRHDAGTDAAARLDDSRHGGLVVIAISPLTAAQIMLLVDRFLGGHFFDTQAGGSAVIWMHFFWIFGHPEVYILVLPAFAIVSEVIPVFSRKPIFGYSIMVAATVSIGFISLGVWAHHLFTIGMTSYANAFFVASTMAIAVPTGIKIFNWLGTMWGGKIRYRVAMMFCVAFLCQFLIAGLTGIMLGRRPLTGNWAIPTS